MANVIDYTANFCESGKCLIEKNILPDIKFEQKKPCNCPEDKQKPKNGKIKVCGYPLVKEGELTTLYGEILDFKVGHYVITLEVIDKFHLSYGPNSQYNCILWLNDSEFCRFSFPCNINSSTAVLRYDFVTNRNYSFLFNSKPLIVKCQITVNKDIIICPKYLTILAFKEGMG